MQTLLVEDDPITRRLLEGLLTERGHAVTACADAEQGWSAYTEGKHPLVLLDWLLPGTDGLTLCRRMRQMPGGNAAVIVVLTSRSSLDDLREVLDAGADDYLTKPVDARLLNIRLTIAERWARNRLDHEESERSLRSLRAMLRNEGRFGDFVGKSDRMQHVYRLIREVARVDATVLIEGETGTGKELVARAIHEESARRGEPFIAVNSAGLSETLLTSQLFGHKRGAFTGAVEDHRGFFEAADRGTLFLDEIGDVPSQVQTSLLRVLQEREVIRLGESRPRKVDVRVLVATHRDLAVEIERGNFRADLLYRIRVGRILLPPLRERREDIPGLVDFFLDQLSASTGKRIDRVSEEAMQRLLEYHWPGNVRELRSALEFAVIHCKGTSVGRDDLPPELSQPLELAIPERTTWREDDRQRIRAALAAARGNRTAAARLLGVSRATLYRRIADLSIA